MEVSTIYSEMNYYSHNGALLSKENSEDLSASIREGEEEAFGELFDQYQQFIARFIYGMVGDHEITQELTQETFMGAYRFNLRDKPIRIAHRFDRDRIGRFQLLDAPPPSSLMNKFSSAAFPLRLNSKPLIALCINLLR
jgi:hypothetical protein